MIAGEELTEDFADLLYTAGNVVFLHGVAHRYANITLKPLAKTKPLIVVAFDSEIENSFYAQ